MIEVLLTLIAVFALAKYTCEPDEKGNTYKLCKIIFEKEKVDNE